MTDQQTVGASNLANETASEWNRSSKRKAPQKAESFAKPPKKSVSESITSSR